MSRLFVTGATGVLGRRVVPLLVGLGHDVTAVARSEAKADQVRAHGAAAVEVDLFDPAAVAGAVRGHDAVFHLATNIPTGASTATKRGWRINDRLRSETSLALSRAAIDAGIDRYVQESITFPYVDGGTDWIDEQVERTYFWGNRSTADAEAAAASVTAAGGSGVVLRFAMFAAADSAHMHSFVSIARKGISGLFGEDDAYISFIDIDDAASAVAAALSVPAGIYNVGEAEPLTRGEHNAALATAVGRDRLRQVPGMLEKAAGSGVESLARSHRISTDALQAASSWRPERRGIDMWKDLT
jgi:nucleoside-diphosphate-sugar epimerase